ncbi:nucleotide-diphospho-sugar transferase [Aspergillus aurantiobrunneus]
MKLLHSKIFRLVSTLALFLPAAIPWQRFAYAQYVTNTDYLCNSVMHFETLHRLGSRAGRLIMYPSEFSLDDDSPENRLLIQARDCYGVKLLPVAVQKRGSADDTWSEGYTKLLAFNQTQYDRLLVLDSDSMIRQTMDELFLLHNCPMAAPRSYWEPGTHRIMDAIENAGENAYDMEIANNLYRDSAFVIPHRPYGLLTGEFRSKDHAPYLGNRKEQWDPVKALSEAKFLHYADWPLPKQRLQPSCEIDPRTGYEDDCHAREIWRGLYKTSEQQRLDICNMTLKGTP